MPRRLWRNYSLGFILASLWLFWWTVQTISGWVEFQAEQAGHGQTATVADYLPVWLRATAENNASEFLQLFSFVVLTAYFVYRGSHESRDGQDRLEGKLDAHDAAFRERFTRVDDNLAGLTHELILLEDRVA